MQFSIICIMHKLWIILTENKAEIQLVNKMRKSLLNNSETSEDVIVRWCTKAASYLKPIFPLFLRKPQKLSKSRGTMRLSPGDSNLNHFKTHNKKITLMWPHLWWLYLCAQCSVDFLSNSLWPWWNYFFIQKRTLTKCACTWKSVE